MSFVRVVLVVSLFSCGPVPKYSDVSERVFVPRCATTYCHGDSGIPAGNIILTREKAYAALVGKPTTGVDWPSSPYAGLLLVDPGSPDDSALMKSLERRDDLPERYRMPTGGVQLSAAELELVRAWIAGGALP